MAAAVETPQQAAVNAPKAEQQKKPNDKKNKDQNESEHPLEVCQLIRLACILFIGIEYR
jgi:hypothetical protein